MNTYFSRLNKYFNKSILILLFFCLGFQNCSMHDMDSYMQTENSRNSISGEMQEQPIRRQSYKIEDLSIDGDLDPKLGGRCLTCQVVVKKSGACSGFWKNACIAIIFLVIGGIIGFLPTFLVQKGEVVIAKAETDICNAKLAINQDCANLKLDLCNNILSSSCASILAPTSSNYC